MGHKCLGLPWIVSYEKVSRFFVADEERDEKIIPTVIPNWDHSPRSGKQGLVLHCSEPEYFECHLKSVMMHIKEKPLEHRLAFVKSWNEWAEGNYLEPDLRYGKRYLEVIEKCVVSKGVSGDIL